MAYQQEKAADLLISHFNGRWWIISPDNGRAHGLDLDELLKTAANVERKGLAVVQFGKFYDPATREAVLLIEQLGRDLRSMGFKHVVFHQVFATKIWPDGHLIIKDSSLKQK